MTIIERLQRPNRQPVVQESRSKLAKQADPNLYGPNADQGRGFYRCWQCRKPIEANDDAHVCIGCGGLNRPLECERRPVHGTGIVLVLLLGLSIGLPFLLHACTRVAS